MKILRDIRWQFNKFLEANILTSFVQGAGIVLILQVLGAILSYVGQVLLAQWMGPAEYGIYDYAMAWSSLLAIFAGIGFPTSVLRLIPEYIIRCDWARLRGVIYASWNLTLIVSLILSALSTVLILWLTNKGLKCSTSLLLGVWMIPLLALVMLQSEMSRAIQQVGLAYAPLQVIWPFLSLGSAFLYIQISQTLKSLPAISAAMLALLAILFIQLRLFWQKLPSEIYRTSSIYEIHEWLRISLPLLLSDGFFIVLNQTDVLIIGVLLDSINVGIYSAATRSANWVSFILLSVNAVAAPIFASLYAQGDQKALQKLVSTLAHCIFWPSLVIAIFLIVFARPILGTFGSEFVGAQWEMTVLTLSQLINAGSGSVGYLMIMTGHQNQTVRVFGWSALINITLNVLCIPLFGIMGAALATAFTMILWNIWLHILVVKKLNVYPSILYALSLSAK
jgi:O-antigen/teichoic acid export membrane protein